MSRLKNLLTQDAPLEKSEIQDLKNWIEVLNDDMDTFGATDEDNARVAAIKARIKKEEARG